MTKMRTELAGLFRSAQAQPVAAALPAPEPPCVAEFVPAPASEDEKSG